MINRPKCKLRERCWAFVKLVEPAQSTALVRSKTAALPTDTKSRVVHSKLMIQLERAAASMQPHVVAPCASWLRRPAALLMEIIASQAKLVVVTDACPREIPAAQVAKISAIRSYQNAAAAAAAVVWHSLRTVALMAPTAFHLRIIASSLMAR